MLPPVSRWSVATRPTYSSSSLRILPRDAAECLVERNAQALVADRPVELALGGLERVLDGHGERTDERLPGAHRGGDDLEIVGELGIELAARA